MSTYFQKSYSNEESIYNLIPLPVEEREKTTMYRSKYSSNIPPTASTFRGTSSQILLSNVSGDTKDLKTSKKPFGVFGPKEVFYPDPNRFQRAHDTDPLPEPERFTYRSTMKPKLDTHNETFRTSSPISKSNTTRNYIKENTMSMILSEAKSSPTGTMDYMSKPDYGQTPIYLNKVKNQIESEKEYVRTMLAKQQEEKERDEPKTRLLPESERLELLADLKSKWTVVNKQYQLMTHLVTLDTTGKIRRKEESEQQLSQLERAIERLSKKNVYVADDQ